MNYIGSKYKLSSWIKESIRDVVKKIDDKTFCDLFAGTGIVGRAFKKDVKKVIANDIEYYSYVLNKNYIQNLSEYNSTRFYIPVFNKNEIETNQVFLTYTQKFTAN